MAEAKDDFGWLAEVPGHCLQQTLIDLDQACARHGMWKVRWKSRVRNAPSFRFPEGGKITVERLNRRWARAKLPKLGWVRLRRTCPLGRKAKNATVRRGGELRRPQRQPFGVVVEHEIPDLGTDVVRGHDVAPVSWA
ncbi:hypothetical protein AB0B56_27705 [Streptosporangium canum]|uniref:hypothetical protein n=1 Tax=Streptosporangium canum TaxID=324952 RepID=UPI00343E3982